MLDQTRGQVEQAAAKYAQSGLPAFEKPKKISCTLEVLLSAHFEPWAVADVKGGRHYPDRLRSVFPRLLRHKIVEIDVPKMERWWRGRAAGPDAVTKAAAARICLHAVYLASGPDSSCPC